MHAPPHYKPLRPSNLSPTPKFLNPKITTLALNQIHKPKPRWNPGLPLGIWVKLTHWVRGKNPSTFHENPPPVPKCRWGAGRAPFRDLGKVDTLGPW